MAALKEVLRVVPGWDEDQFESLFRRKVFTTEFEPGVRGRARDLSRENSLEAAFVYALILAKLPVDEAVKRAGEWLAQVNEPAFQPFYALNPATMLGDHFGVEEMSYARLANRLPDARGQGGGWEGEMPTYKPPVTITIINRAEIVRRVDALFTVAA